MSDVQITMKIPIPRDLFPEPCATPFVRRCFEGWRPPCNPGRRSLATHAIADSIAQQCPINADLHAWSLLSFLRYLSMRNKTRCICVIFVEFITTCMCFNFTLLASSPTFSEVSSCKFEVEAHKICIASLRRLATLPTHLHTMMNPTWLTRRCERSQIILQCTARTCHNLRWKPLRWSTS